MKQISPQYGHKNYGQGDKEKKAKPVGYRYKMIRDNRTGRLRAVTKDDKEYYQVPPKKLIEAFENGDKKAQKMIYFERRKDHSDVSGRRMRDGGEFGSWFGTDANLQISLEEYVFVARKTTKDYPDEYQVVYKISDDAYGVSYVREKFLNDLINADEWASEEDVESFLSFVGMSKEEWIDSSFAMKLSDVISYWGSENILGTEYHPNDKKWAYEFVGIEDDDFYAKGGKVGEIKNETVTKQSIKSKKHPFTFTFGDAYRKGDIVIQRVGGSDMWNVGINGEPMGRVLGSQTKEVAFKKAEKLKFSNGGGVGSFPFLKFEDAQEGIKKVNKGELPKWFSYVEKEKSLYYLPNIEGDWVKLKSFETKEKAIEWVKDNLKSEGFSNGGGVRSSNKDSRALVQSRTPFNANNLSGELYGDTYVVKSYGYYPVFVYKNGTWYENSNKYSKSTAKQMGQARPTSDTNLVSTEELKAMYEFEDGGSVSSELQSIENTLHNQLSSGQKVSVELVSLYVGRKPNYEENIVGYKIRKCYLQPYFKRID